MKDKQGKVAIRGKRPTKQTKFEQDEEDDVTRQVVEEEEDEDKYVPLPDDEQRCVNAKLYLLTSTQENSTNFYDHMSDLIGNILVDKPENPYKNLEDISFDLKREKFRFNPSTLQNLQVPSETETLAKVQQAAFKKSGKETTIYLTGDDDDIEEDKYRTIPNLLRQSQYFEQSGCGLQREEFVRMVVALRDLVERYPIVTLRFWGKILGTQKNYYVAETEYQEGEYESDVSEDEEDKDEDMDKSVDDTTFESTFDEYSDMIDMRPLVKKPKRIPCEELGTGLNRKVYFVCNEPGLPWIRLPHVTPAQVVGARQIKRFLTGNLDALIVTYPPFPGIEKNYLRAQIARISAATTISPIGYFRFDDQEEEEEEEDGAGRSHCVLDTEYEGRSLRELADTSLQSWCHHVQAILPQGRNTWFNPVGGKDESGDEDEDEEDREEPDEPEPEVGPPLLSPLSEDLGSPENPAWTAGVSSKFLPEFSIAVVKSNIWPGSVTFAADKGRFFETLYVGWGVKNNITEFDPVLPTEPQWEFPSGPEIAEVEDPSPEEESAMKAAIQDKEFEARFAEGAEDDGDDTD